MAGFDDDRLKQLFPVLSNYEVVVLIAVGYPATKARPHRMHDVRKPLQELVRYL